MKVRYINGVRVKDRGAASKETFPAESAVPSSACNDNVRDILENTVTMSEVKLRRSERIKEQQTKEQSNSTKLGEAINAVNQSPGMVQDRKK